jgi:hypothetical protein
MGNLCTTKKNRFGSVVKPPAITSVLTRSAASFHDIVRPVDLVPLGTVQETREEKNDENRVQLEILQKISSIQEDMLVHKQLLQQCLAKVEETSARLPTARKQLLSEERMNTNRELWNILAQPSIAKHSARIPVVGSARRPFSASTEVEEKIQKLGEVFKRIETN